MKKLMYVLLCLFMAIGLATAQTTRVSGTVTSAEDGEPIIGASITVKGSQIGAVTDFEGKFSLNVPTDVKTLTVTYIGMVTQEVTVAPVMNIRMEPSHQRLDEVMVVAYGTAKKESFTGSAAVIGNEKIGKRTVTNITKAIDGQVAGVQATSGSGQPGSGASIMIRGFGSINASSNPLYVVDGIPYDGNISSINPSDIESMTILKDAAAGALYGARGANGVVVITTKKGKSGKVEISYKGSVGWSSRGIQEYEMLGMDDFVTLNYESLRNSAIFNNNYSWAAGEAYGRSELGGALGGKGGELYNPYKNYSWGELIDPATGAIRSDAVAAWNENWMDEITVNNAFRTEHLITATGGTDKLSAMFSLGYLNEDGILATTNFERYSARANVEATPNNWLKGHLNTALVHTRQNFLGSTGSSTGNVWYTAQFMGPIYPIYVKDAEGNNVLDEFGNKQFDYGKQRPVNENFNTIATLYDDKYGNKIDNASARTGITIGSDEESAGWLQGLKLSANFGVDYSMQNSMQWYNPHHGNQADQGGMLYKFSYRTQSFTFNQLLTWNRKFAEHGFSFLLGHEYYQFGRDYLEGAKTGMVDGIFELAPGVNIVNATSYSQDYRIESVLGRFEYNFKERYYLSGSWRTDGSSRFHKDHRWGNFWSVGGTWRMSEEEFMQDLHWLDNLSLKVSYGEQGNDAILDGSDPDYYAWQGLYGVTWPNNNQPGSKIVSLQNETVSWEKNGNLNVGVEAKFFGSRLDVTLEYFNKKTTDMLLQRPMALSTGFSGYWDNSGSMRNQGLEFTIGGVIVDNEDFQWRATLMGNTIKNKVLKLTSDNPELIYSLTTITEGKPLNTFYLSKTAGVDPATGTQLYWAYTDDEDGNRTEYITADKEKAGASKYYLGSRIPDFFGSFGSEFTFLKSIDLSFLTTFSIGGKMFDSLYSGLMAPMYVGNAWSKHMERRWQKPGDVTDVPRAEVNPSYATNDRSLIDASYFAIKNITLGYTFPQATLKSIGLSSVRVYGTLDNFATFTKLKGTDPQYNFTGAGNGYTYKPVRSFSFGLEVTF